MPKKRANSGDEPGEGRGRKHTRKKTSCRGTLDRFLRRPNVDCAVVTAPGHGTIIIRHGEGSFISHDLELSDALSPKQKQRFAQKFRTRLGIKLPPLKLASVRTFGDLLELLMSRIP